MYGTTGQNLIKFYQDSTSGVDWEVISALWPMGDPIRDKQALKVGIEATLGDSAVILQAFIDSENQTSTAIDFSNNIFWTNNLGNPIPWENSSAIQIGWLGGISSTNGYYLYRSDAKMYGKYLGITLTATSAPFTINGFQLEHELRARF